MNVSSIQYPLIDMPQLTDIAIYWPKSQDANSSSTFLYVFCQIVGKAYITNSQFINAIRLRYDYDEKLTCSFLARVEWKQARAMRRSRIVLS